MMQERPTLEQMNIPIKVLLSNPFIWEEVHSICLNQCVDDTFLTGAAVTFRQLSLLAKSRIPGETMDLIFEFLDTEDRRNPVYLEEVYPYLRQPAWSLMMSEISYFKVSAERSGDYIFSIHKIQKETDSASGKPYLILYPEDDRNFGRYSENEGERMAEKVKVMFDHEYQMQLFMKKIILNGTVDLEDRQSKTPLPAALHI